MNKAQRKLLEQIAEADAIRLKLIDINLEDIRTDSRPWRRAELAEECETWRSQLGQFEPPQVKGERWKPCLSTQLHIRTEIRALSRSARERAERAEEELARATAERDQIARAYRNVHGRARGV